MEWQTTKNKHELISLCNDMIRDQLQDTTLVHINLFSLYNLTLLNSLSQMPSSLDLQGLSL